MLGRLAVSDSLQPHGLQPTRPPHSTGILQARILEWVALPSSKGSFQPRDRTQVSHIAGGFFYQLSYQESPRILEWVVYPFSRTSSPPRNQTEVSCIACGFFTSRSTREPQPLTIDNFKLYLWLQTFPPPLPISCTVSVYVTYIISSHPMFLLRAQPPGKFLDF